MTLVARVLQGPNKYQNNNAGRFFPRGERDKSSTNGKVKPTFKNCERVGGLESPTISWDFSR